MFSYTVVDEFVNRTKFKIPKVTNSIIDLDDQLISTSVPNKREVKAIEKHS